MCLECGEKCAHLDKSNGICKQWFRCKLAFAVKEMPDGALQKVYMRCSECLAVEDDTLFKGMLRKVRFVFAL